MSDSDTSSDAQIAYHDSQGKNLLENNGFGRRVRSN